MKRNRPKPRRPLRNELLSLLPILAAPLVMGLLFPYEAIGYREPVPARATPPSCVVVELYEDVQAKALELVRSAFSVKSEDFQTMREDLLLAPLPEERPAPILRSSDRRALTPPAHLAYDVVPLPPSLAAPDPEAQPADDPTATEPPAFSREELLKLD